MNIKENMDQKTSEKLFEFISEVCDSEADLLVIAGDIVESGVEDDYYQAIEILDMVPIEKVFVPGNWDFCNGGNVCFSSCIYDLESALGAEAYGNSGNSRSG